ncbi:MAG: hypothetical protein RLZZ628_239 [Bacteroidota bacterium]|jgi:hypothetical protein
MEKQNFGLTENEFNQLLERLQTEGDETLIEIIFKTQYVPCRKLLMEKYHASYDNAHDVVMELLLKFRLDLIQNKLRYNNLVSFFKTAAWQQYIHVSRESKKCVFLSALESDAVQLEDDSVLVDNALKVQEAIRIEPVIRKAYKAAYESLCAYCKKIIDVYYIHNQLVEEQKKLTWNDMAQMMPKNECGCSTKNKPQKEAQTPGAMKTQANAIRKKLKEKMELSLNAKSETILSYLYQLVKI